MGAPPTLGRALGLGGSGARQALAITGPKEAAAASPAPRAAHPWQGTLGRRRCPAIHSISFTFPSHSSCKSPPGSARGRALEGAILALKLAAFTLWSLWLWGAEPASTPSSSSPPRLPLWAPGSSWVCSTEGQGHQSAGVQAWVMAASGPAATSGAARPSDWRFDTFCCSLSPQGLVWGRGLNKGLSSRTALLLGALTRGPRKGTQSCSTGPGGHCPWRQPA